MKLFAGLFALLLAVAVHAAPIALSSPSGTLTLHVDVNGEGRPDYWLTRGGKPVLERSRLGFILADGPKLERNFTLAEVSRTSADTRWEQPWGERRFVRDRHNELVVELVETGALKRRMRVTFRLFDDGLGFRMALPEQPNLKRARIVEELTEFAVSEPGEAWWIPGGEWNRYEYLTNRTAIDQVAQAHTVMTLRTKSGLHLAIHEAALVDYAAMWLRRVEGQRFKVRLSPAADGPPVVRDLPFHTPWRVVMVAPDAAGLVAASDIILNLNEPNRLGDTGWFRPYKYVGVWWEMHLETASWASGPKHGATTTNTKRYMDFAARHGFRGVLVEGWNIGWDGDWFANGADFSFTRAYPDFDIEALSAYGLKKGVRLIGHHETSANIANYEPQLGAALDLYQRLGIDSVKTGYVADAGGAQAPGSKFEWHDGQRMSRHHLLVVTEAAKRRIAVNPHEPIKDTGLRRTYSNWVAREGARGMEYNAWGDPKNPPSHEVDLVFTRMLAGPMDYTPGILSLTGRGGTPIPSTLARQLALYVTLYSPIQMAADLPENYEKQMAAFQFIKDVPADWAESRLVAGEMGSHAAFARKDRRSEDWYLGAITNEEGKSLDIALDFLTPGKRYEAQVYQDGEGADFRTEARFAIRISKRVVQSSDRLPVKLAPGGGQAIRFRALP